MSMESRRHRRGRCRLPKEDGEVGSAWIVGHVEELEEEEEFPGGRGADPGTGHMKILTVSKENVLAAAGADPSAGHMKINAMN